METSFSSVPLSIATMAVPTTAQKTALLSAGILALLQSGCAEVHEETGNTDIVEGRAPNTKDGQTFQLTKGSILRTPLSTCIVKPFVYTVKQPSDKTLQAKAADKRQMELLGVPRVALQKAGTKTVVYVALPGDKFRETVVETGEEKNDFVEIRTGLKAGERVVTNGAFSLRSHMTK